MSADPQLFRIEPSADESTKMQEVDFARLGFQERRDIQEWVAANPGILGDDLLIIGKEFAGFDLTNERLDLLAVDQDGRLVVIELKRDDTGADAHWQAIKYASYLRRASVEHIVGMLAKYQEVSEEDAANMLMQHLGADDLNALNNDQRIILASHRFAPEVTSAALWLNERDRGDNLITCIQLIPYQDEQTDSLYVQANTIIPVPGAEDYMVGIGSAQGEQPGGFGGRDAQDRANDEVTKFLRRVADLVLGGLQEEIRPDRWSRWAGIGSGASHRYYHLWYKHSPWGNWSASYFVNLYDKEEASDTWRADVGLSYWSMPRLGEQLAQLQVYEDQEIKDGEFRVIRRGEALDESFAHTLAKTLIHFIESTKRQVETLADEGNEEGI